MQNLDGMKSVVGLNIFYTKSHFTISNLGEMLNLALKNNLSWKLK
jgi:hypothetical protein